MAELDYAFVAEYAKVEQGGSLTSVGASYTHLTVPSLPVQHLLCVAGRIRAGVDELPEIGVEIQSPGGNFKLGINMVTTDVSGYRPYDGKIGLLFAANTFIPILVAGLYEVHIAVDGSLARRLAFDVEVSKPNPS